MMYVICSFANDYSLLSARIVFRVSWLMSLHLWWEQDAGGAWKSHGALTSPGPFNVPVGKGHQPSRREHASKPAKQACERACVFLSQVGWAEGSGRLYMLSSPAITIQLCYRKCKFISLFDMHIHFRSDDQRATQPKTSCQFNNPPLSPSNPGSKLLYWRLYWPIHHVPLWPTLCRVMSEKLVTTRLTSDVFSLKMSFRKGCAKLEKNDWLICGLFERTVKKVRFETTAKKYEFKDGNFPYSFHNTRVAKSGWTRKHFCCSLYMINLVLIWKPNKSSKYFIPLRYDLTRLQLCVQLFTSQH